MSVKHLSDTEIQQYLDDKSARLDREKLGHLRGCNECRRAVSEYKRLYTELGRSEDRLLSSNFTARTMAKIGGLERPVSSLNRAAAAYAVFGVLSCLAAIWYFVDLKALLQSAQSFSLGNLAAGSAFVQSLRELSTKFGDSLAILIFAGLLLAAVALADKLLVRQRATKVYFLSV